MKTKMYDEMISVACNEFENLNIRGMIDCLGTSCNYDKSYVT